MEPTVHICDEAFVSHSLGPLLTRPEHDGCVVHVQRRVVGRTVGAPDGPKHAFDFWIGSNDLILLLEQIRG